MEYGEERRDRKTEKKPWLIVAHRFCLQRPRTALTPRPDQQSTERLQSLIYNKLLGIQSGQTTNYIEGQSIEGNG